MENLLSGEPRQLPARIEAGEKSEGIEQREKHLRRHGTRGALRLLGLPRRSAATTSAASAAAATTTRRSAASRASATALGCARRLRRALESRMSGALSLQGGTQGQGRLVHAHPAHALVGGTKRRSGNRAEQPVAAGEPEGGSQRARVDPSPVELVVEGRGQRGASVELDVPLRERPRREVDVRVGEARQNAPTAEVDRVRARERRLVHADAARDPIPGDPERRSRRQRRVERANRPVPEDHAPEPTERSD